MYQAIVFLPLLGFLIVGLFGTLARRQGVRIHHLAASW